MPLPTGAIRAGGDEIVSIASHDETKLVHGLSYYFGFEDSFEIQKYLNKNIRLEKWVWIKNLVRLKYKSSLNTQGFSLAWPDLF